MNPRVAPGDFIDEAAIRETLDRSAASDPVRVRETLARAGELRGLDADGAAATSASSPPSMAGKISKSPPHNAPRPARLCDPAARCHVGERRNRA